MIINGLLGNKRNSKMKGIKTIGTVRIMLNITARKLASGKQEITIKVI